MGELFVQFLAASNAAFHAVFTGRSMSFSLLRGISQKLAPSTREEFFEVLSIDGSFSLAVDEVFVACFEGRFGIFHMSK
jgi:hypothetical protein